MIRFRIKFLGVGLGFEGVYSVLATPFRAGADVDVDSLTRGVDLVIGAGVRR